MDINKRISAFVELGIFLGQFGTNTKHNNELNAAYYEPFQELIKETFYYNGWFTENNVHYAIKSWSEALTRANLDTFTSNYKEQLLTPLKPRNIGVIMAGNIPLVGFHDFIMVLLSGHHLIAKLSSTDSLLLPYLAKVLIAIEPLFESKIIFTESKIKNIDAIIATGSNNSARYFDYYFAKYPHIIRKNRNSVAVLTGKETKNTLVELGADIFHYFGLGCRNVSKLFIPQGYQLDVFFEAIYPHATVLENKKYANNYEYNRVIYLMGGASILDNNFVLLKEDIALAAPVGVINYEYYTTLTDVKERLRMDKDNIQCIVAEKELIKGAIPFGTTQHPQLWDFADGVDTMDFLLHLA